MEPSRGTEESWEHIVDAKERKRVQNRIAQRTYRERVKRRVEALEQWYQDSESTTPPPRKSVRTGAIRRHAEGPEPFRFTRRTSGPAVGADEEEKDQEADRMQSSTSSSVVPLGLTPPLDDTYLTFENFCDIDERQLPPPHDLNWGMGATAPEITPSLDSVTTGSTSHQAPFHFDVCTLGPVTTPPQEASSHDVCKSALQQVASATTCSVSRRKGQTGLHLAAEKGSAATAAALMSMSANTLALDSVGRTPLHIAVEYCNEPVVAQLATHIEAINTKNLDGETALHLAVSLGHEQIVQILLAAAGCNMELKDGSGRTALHLAVLHGHEGILRKLVGNGANIDARIEM